MSTNPTSPTCAAIIQKKLARTRLTEEEKAHLLECPDCLPAIIDQVAERAGTNPEQDPEVRERLQKILEKSRAVFERETGVSLPTKQS